MNKISSMKADSVAVVEGVAKFCSHQSYAAPNLEGIHKAGFWFPVPIYYLIDYFLYVGQWLELQLYFIRNCPEFIQLEYAIEQINHFMVTQRFKYRTGKLKGSRGNEIL